MEREEVSRMPILPEDVVEKILGMVPFPNIFKARALSKSWLARLSPVSSQDEDKVTSSVAILFQRRMSEYWSAKWIFCPVFFFKETLVVYNPISHTWKSIPLLSFLPENYIKSNFRFLAGALLITVPLQDRCSLLVANVLTGTWRLLPPCPWVRERNSIHPLEITPVIHKETYRVIALDHSYSGLSSGLIYDSKVDAWRIKKFELPKGFRNHSAGVYLNGVVYWLVGPKEDTRGLLLFKVVEETFVFLDMPQTRASSFLKVCAGRLLTAFYIPLEGRADVKTVDIESQKWLEVIRGPPKAACDCRLITLVHYVIDPDCLFFLVRKRGHDQILLRVYSVQNNSWSDFNISTQDAISRGFLCSFQPGLNPFMRP